MNNCPKCKTVLLVGAIRCTCGWQSAEATDATRERRQAAKSYPLPNTICAWEMPGKRCPMPSAGRTFNGLEMCIFHGRYQRDKTKAQECWDRINRVIDGNATQLNEFLVKTIHDASYWGAKGSDWHVKWEEVKSARQNAPAWYPETIRKMLAILNKDEEKKYGIFFESIAEKALKNASIHNEETQEKIT